MSQPKAVPTLKLEDFPEHAKKAYQTRLKEHQESHNDVDPDRSSMIGLAQVKKWRKSAPVGAEAFIIDDWPKNLHLFMPTPLRHALDDEEVRQATDALRKLDFKTLSHLTEKSREREAQGDQYVGPWYEPRTSDEDVLSLSKLAAGLCLEFHLLGSDPKPLCAFTIMPLHNERYAAFWRIVNDLHFETIDFSAANDFHHTMVCFQYIVQRYAVGDLIYSNDSLDRRLISLSQLLWSEKNACKLKFVLNYLLPVFLCTLLAADEIGASMVMMDAVSRIESLLGNFQDLRMTTCDQIHKALRQVWRPEQPLLFAHVLHLFLDCDAREIANGTTASLRDYFVDVYGKNGEEIVQSLQRTKLHRFGVETAVQIEDLLGITFVRKYYEKIGYIMTQKLIALIVDASETASLSDILAVIHGQLIGQIPKGFSKGWLKHQTGYSRLRQSDTETWSRANQQISEEASGLCNTMLNSKQVDVTAVLEDKWTGDVKRVLIARRIILGMAKGEPDEGMRLYMMGFIKDKEDIASGFKLNREPYRQYYHQIGLTAEVIKDPLQTDGLWPEERAWFEAFTLPPK